RTSPSYKATGFAAVRAATPSERYARYASIPGTAIITIRNDVVTVRYPPRLIGRSTNRYVSHARGSAIRRIAPRTKKRGIWSCRMRAKDSNGQCQRYKG